VIDLTNDIRQRAAMIQDRIDAAARKSGRDSGSVLLIAVTKTHGADLVQATADAGLRHFGENRVEEAGTKIDALRDTLPQDVTWHMIGHIQSRKADQVAGYFGWVHSVDRLKVARLLSAGLGERGRSAEILLEVNLSGEEAKSGYALSRWPADPAQSKMFYDEVGQVLALPHIRVCGLMTVAPLTEDAEAVRPVFKRLRQLRDELQRTFTSVDWRHLSMGMSGDFEAAIEEGATMVRLGTALFGPRI
jgi:pyridoxal phosphate enzyme (YggS family)